MSDIEDRVRALERKFEQLTRYAPVLTFDGGDNYSTCKCHPDWQSPPMIHRVPIDCETRSAKELAGVLREERDEARRERDELVKELSASRGRVSVLLNMVKPLAWSPEPPKVEGLYAEKRVGSNDYTAEAEWYGDERIKATVWIPGWMYCGPLVIREAEEGGGA